MLINTKELIKRTGASFRQIDYWCRMGVISTVGKGTPGSGYYRQFDEEIVNRVKLVVKVSKAFGRPLHTKELKGIYDNCDRGMLELGDGIGIIWDDEFKSAK